MDYVFNNVYSFSSDYELYEFYVNTFYTVWRFVMRPSTCAEMVSLLQTISPTINTALQRSIHFYLTLISARCLSTRSVLGCISNLPSAFGMRVLKVLSNPGL